MLSRRAAWAVVLAATATMTVSYVDRAALGTLGKTISDDLHISNAEFGWLGTAFAAAYLVATPIAGWWIDRFGARRGLVTSLIVWSVIAALHSVIPGFWSLFMLRIMLGLAEGPGFPGAAQTVQRVLPAAERERGFGVLFTGSSIGLSVAGPLATVLFIHFGWRTALLQTAVVGLAWIPLWLIVTRSKAVRERLDRPTEPSTSGTRATFFELLRHPAIVRGLIAILCVSSVNGFLQQWGSKYLNNAFGVVQADVGTYIWLPPLCLDLGAVVFGDLASRQRRAPGVPPNVLFAIAAVMAASMSLLAVTATPWQSMTVLGIAMAGGGGCYALVTSDMLSRLPAGQVSFAGGILACAQSIAAMVAHPLIGSAIDAYDSYTGVVIALGMIVLPGALIWLLWQPRRLAEIN